MYLRQRRYKQCAEASESVVCGRGHLQTAVCRLPQRIQRTEHDLCWKARRVFLQCKTPFIHSLHLYKCLLYYFSLTGMKIKRIMCRVLRNFMDSSCSVAYALIWKVTVTDTFSGRQWRSAGIQEPE